MKSPGRKALNQPNPSACDGDGTAVRDWELLMKERQVSGVSGLLPDMSLVPCCAVPPSWVWGGSWVRQEAVVQL